MNAGTREARHGENNFDLIRLFAASQVAILHCAHHLGIGPNPLFAALEYFPGVPIFFFISGLLIYQSYANIKESRTRTFFTNRFLRLYPALVSCFVVTVLSLHLSGYLRSAVYTPGQFLAWAAASLSVFQFYNPGFLRGYGVGTVNGSLWTISVEIQFYILTPLLFLVFRRGRAYVFAAATVFLVANAVNTFFGDNDRVLWKLFGVSFVPWFYMFMAGAYLSSDERLQRKVLSVDATVYLVAYLAAYALSSKLGLGEGNSISVLSFIPLCLLVYKLAHTAPRTAGRLLARNDISYGVYIYHMPVVNLWIFLGFGGTAMSIVSALAVTLCLASASWFLVEKPSLKLKRIALRRYA